MLVHKTNLKNLRLMLHQVYFLITIVVVAQSLSHVRLFIIPWTAAHQASLSLTISWNLPKENNGMKLEISKRRKTGKFTNMWKVTHS